MFDIITVNFLIWIFYNFFLMHREGYRAVKRPIRVKKSKVNRNFFVIKATNLKTIILKNPCKIDKEKYATS